MTWILEDRRVRRSNDRQVALRYQLEHTRSHGNLEALIVSDRDGLLLGAAGDAVMCEELGAVAPLMSRAPLGMMLPPLLSGADVAIRPLTLNGGQFYMASVGGGVARDALLKNSGFGVQRILASN